MDKEFINISQPNASNSINNPKTGRNFIAWTDINHLPVDLIDKIEKLPCYYYAWHNPETDDCNNEHIHIVALTNQKQSKRKWADYLGIPENMVEILQNQRGAVRYLIHLDNPEKGQYPASIIKTNCPNNVKLFLSDEKTDYEVLDFEVLTDDFIKLKQKKITPGEFTNKYKWYICKSPSKFNYYLRIIKDIWITL